MQIQVHKSIRYNSFLSTARPDLSEQYYAGLAGALKKYNVDQVILSKLEQELSENIYIVLATNQEDKVLGGVRVEIKSTNHKLPIEKSDIPKQHFFNTQIKNILSQNMHVGEVCGLWANSQNTDIDKSVSLGAELSYQGLKCGLDLGIDVLTAIVPRHTLAHTIKIGFIPDSVINDISYPDDRYLSTVIWYYNPQSEKTVTIRSTHTTAQTKPESEQTL